MSLLRSVKFAQNGFTFRVEEFVCHWTFYFWYTNSWYSEDFVCILLLVAFWNGISSKAMRTRSATLNLGFEPREDCRFWSEPKWGTCFALTSSAAIPIDRFRRLFTRDASFWSWGIYLKVWYSSNYLYSKIFNVLMYLSAMQLLVSLYVWYTSVSFSLQNFLNSHLISLPSSTHNFMGNSKVSKLTIRSKANFAARAVFDFNGCTRIFRERLSSARRRYLTPSLNFAIFSIYPTSKDQMWFMPSEITGRRGNFLWAGLNLV